MLVVTDLKVLYFDTPVVLIGIRNPDGTGNLAPMSSAWWLGQRAMLGMGNASQTSANIRRERECTLNLVPSHLVDAVDRLALLTGASLFPETKAARGYRTERDKFAASGLTALRCHVVGAPRVAECPIRLECRLVDLHPFGPTATAFEVEVARAHAEPGVLVPGTAYVDPLAWDPLIMKFCEYFGGGRPLRDSSLARGWQLPQAGRRGRGAPDRVT